MAENGGGQGGDGGQGGGQGGNGGQGGGAGENAFLQTLPEEFRADPNFKDIKDLGALAKSFVNAQALIGKKRVAIPAENAPEAELRAFFKELGVPEKPEEYGFKDDGLPKDMLGREGMVKFIQGLFHKAGVPKKSAEQIFGAYNEYMKAEMEKIGQGVAAEKGKRVETLKKDLGAEFEKSIQIARGVAKQFDPTGTLAKWLDDTGMGDHPDLVKAFNAIGRAIGPDRFITGGGAGSGGGATTQQEALDRINKNMTNPEWIKKYTDKNAAGHKETVEAHLKDMEIAHPNTRG